MLELVNKCVTETVGEVSNISIDSENHGIHGIVFVNKQNFGERTKFSLKKTNEEQTTRIVQRN